jgi:hypothetical protein
MAMIGLKLARLLRTTLSSVPKTSTYGGGPESFERSGAAKDGESKIGSPVGKAPGKGAREPTHARLAESIACTLELQVPCRDHSEVP